MKSASANATLHIGDKVRLISVPEVSGTIVSVNRHGSGLSQVRFDRPQVITSYMGGKKRRVRKSLGLYLSADLEAI